MNRMMTIVLKRKSLLRVLITLKKRCLKTILRKFRMRRKKKNKKRKFLRSLLTMAFSIKLQNNFLRKRRRMKKTILILRIRWQQLIKVISLL